MSTAGAAQGAVVTSCDETSLRAAMAGGGVTTISCDGTIVLSATLVVSNDTVLDGSGRSVVISGNNAVRVLSVNPGVRLTMISLTLANGRYAGTNGLQSMDGESAFGAAIYNDHGTVDLISCTVSNHVIIAGNGGGGSSSSAPSNGGTAGGGAVFNKEGVLNLTNCLFQRNLAVGGIGGPSFLVNYSGNGGHAFGGAIFNQDGTLTIAQTVFAANSATGGLSGNIGVGAYGTSGSGFGGAVHSRGGGLIVENCSFFANNAVGAQLPWNGIGAGLANGGALSLSNSPANCVRSVFGTNTALGGAKARYGTAGEGMGGAIFSDSVLTLGECTFDRNLATTGTAGVSGGDGKGGALCALGVAHVLGCTFSENQAQGGNGVGVGGIQVPGSGGNGLGGAIYIVTDLRITNSTIFRNLARGGDGMWSGQGGAGSGGGVYNTNGAVDVMNCTLFINSAVGGKVNPAGAGSPGIGQGGSLYATNGPLTVRNTIVAGSPSSSNCFGAIIDAGYNISSDASCDFSAPGSLTNTDPVLGPFDDYGGPTFTLPLSTGSPAIDGGDSLNCPPADQRGHTRPFGLSCDVGAFESSPPFLIRGHVSRYLPASGIQVSAGTQSAAVAQDHSYTVTGLDSGTYAVSASGPEAVTVPAARIVIVGPDRLNINFDAYVRNGLWIEPSSNNATRIVYGGTNGQTHRVEITYEWPGWQPYSTNSVGSNNIFEWYETNRLGAGCFRTVRLSP